MSGIWSNAEVYYPPDFDPAALSKHEYIQKRKRKQQERRESGRRREGGELEGKRAKKLTEVRFMFPWTWRCGACSDFVYVGTKFNSKVEKLQENYLGIAIWRFYGKCPSCGNQIIFKTDPKNTDYILEQGGVRTSDANRDQKLAQEKERERLEKEREADSVRAIELKSLSTAKEIETLDQLSQLRTLSRRFLTAPDELSDKILADLTKARARANANTNVNKNGNSIRNTESQSGRDRENGEGEAEEEEDAGGGSSDSDSNSDRGAESESLPDSGSESESDSNSNSDLRKKVNKDTDGNNKLIDAKDPRAPGIPKGSLFSRLTGVATERTGDAEAGLKENAASAVEAAEKGLLSDYSDSD